MNKRDEQRRRREEKQRAAEKNQGKICLPGISEW